MKTFAVPDTVMLKTFQNYQPWNSRNTVMLKNFQKFQNSGIYGQAEGRFPKILEFFEHYSVSWVLSLNLTKHWNAKKSTFRSLKAHKTWA